MLLLVSSDFIASDYCWGEEMTKALARHARGEARVIPVILRHCRWRSTPLAGLQAVPKDAKPIKSWTDEDEAFDDVVAAIERAVQTARQKTPKAPPPTSGDRFGTPTILQIPRREPGTVFREINEPWCPELVVIPAGSFVMGSPETEEGRSPYEGPQHEVRFAQPFALGRYPVTFEEYDHFCDSTTAGKKSRDEGWGRGRRPVINVSFEDAEVYCAWLSARTGGKQYRLPSEAEWEYACRAGTTTPFWTGATISIDQANYSGNYVYGPGRKGEYRAQTTPVDEFEANPWGLHDMHGNVWEWVEDCWNDGYEGAPNDGSARTSGNCDRRVLRGGSWYDFPGFLRSASRIGVSAGVRVDVGGFRVARTASRSESVTP